MEFFLKEDEQKKLMILKHLESHPESLIKASFFCEKLGIKDSRLEKLIDELKKELFEFEDNPKIKIEGEVLSNQNLKLSHIKQIQLNYFLESMTFLYFRDFLEGRVTPKSFGEKHFFSEGSGYLQQRSIKRFLGEYEIKIKNGRLVGSEIKIRNLFFSVLFDVFEGMRSPFSKEIDQQVNDIGQLFEKYFFVDFPNTKKIKFHIFLGIVLCRIQEHCYLDGKEDYFYLNNEAYNSLISQFQNKVHIGNHEIACREVKYILAFLKAEGVNPLFISTKEDPFHEIDSVSETIAKEILCNLNKKNSVRAEEFTTALKEINRNHVVFEYILSAFSSKAQFQYFFDAYPYFSTTIRSTIETHKNKLLFGNSTVLNQLFYEYAFLVNKYYAANEIEEPIYINIDFSLGELYTQFIADEVSCFKNMNIRVESKLSNKTDIYLSDCIVQNLQAKSIIWKKPPTAEDWQEFGDLIISIRKRKSQSVLVKQ